MKKIKLLLALGTRPEVIKMAPLYFACRERESLCPLLCASGQHAELLDTALLDFGLTPEWRFATETGDLAQITSRMLLGFSQVLDTLSPHAVLVHGDTATAFSAALAAFYKEIPVLHVEAGLRTGDLSAPFPEELYREVIDRLSLHCFAPTETAYRRLLAEGRPRDTVSLCGNTVVDALGYTVCKSFSHPLLKQAEGKRLILLTCHRREGRSALPSLLTAVRRAVEERDDVLVLFPVHPTPSTKQAAEEILGDHAAFRLLPPLDTRLFHNLLARAHLLLTDSGGAEEEATALGIPTLVLRDKTERTEGVEAGILIPVGTDSEAVYTALKNALAYPPTVTPSTVYGDGRAAQRIAEITDFILSQQVNIAL